MAAWNRAHSQPVWQLVVLMSSSDSGRCHHRCHPGRLDAWHHSTSHVTPRFPAFVALLLSPWAYVCVLISFPALSASTGVKKNKKKKHFHEEIGHQKKWLAFRGDSDKGENATVVIRATSVSSVILFFFTILIMFFCLILWDHFTE